VVSIKPYLRLHFSNQPKVVWRQKHLIAVVSLCTVLLSLNPSVITCYWYRKERTFLRSGIPVEGIQISDVIASRITSEWFMHLVGFISFAHWHHEGITEADNYQKTIQNTGVAKQLWSILTLYKPRLWEWDRGTGKWLPIWSSFLSVDWLAERTSGFPKASCFRQHPTHLLTDIWC